MDVAKIFVPDPSKDSFELWASRVAEDLVGQTWLPKPQESRWKAWAKELFFSGSVAAEAIPDPGLYNTWREWATKWMTVQN